MNHRSRTGPSSRLARMCAACLTGVVVALCGWVVPARAQQAPAGNERPVEAASAVDDLSNPFGPPSASTFDTMKKEAFAASVDLAPLRDLAVYHSGRVKILDTLGREVVLSLVGRKDYVDFVVDEAKHSARRVHYSPVFTLMDLAIDPGYYLDRPLVHVEYLPLREAFLEQLYPVGEEREWWKRLGRLKPVGIARNLESIEARHAFDAPYRRGLERVRGALGLFERVPQLFAIVAPVSQDQPWEHVSRLPESSAIARACKELGAAWRAGDADKANAAIRTLAAELPKVNAPMYPASRRGLELTVNRLNAFEWGYWLYALALLSFVLAFGTGRKTLAMIGLATFAGALAMHGFGFVSRCIIAERFAIQNQFESMTGISLFAALVGATLMLLRKQWLFGAAASGVGFLVLITATQTGVPGAIVEREAAILNTSILLKYHVTTVLVSYGLIALGFMVSLFYLGTHYASRARARTGTMMLAGVGPVSTQTTSSQQPPTQPDLVALSAGALGLNECAATSGPARVLSDLDKAQMVILQLAFWTLGVGILLGAWWADHSWGRWWAFDPKELWALITWIVYLIVIHLRIASLPNKALITAWMSVIGFFVMLWTYFGVNLLLPGLHAYA